MKDIVLHSRLNVAAREFHIHTGSVLERNCVLSEIFESGKFIGAKEVPFKQREVDRGNAKVGYLKHLASDLHRNTIEELNMLFYIRTKIEPLKLLQPHFKLGSLFFYRNLTEEAIASFRLCLEIKNDYIPAYIMLGKCCLNIKDYPGAVDILLEGYKINSEYPDLANTLGVALTFNRNYQKAISILQQALKKNPGFDEANFNLGVAIFLSTLSTRSQDQRVIVPSRIIRFVRSLKILDRYKSQEWQDLFDQTLERIDTAGADDLIHQLQLLQIKLVTHLKIDPLIESFYLKFMYGGRELSYNELESYESRILELSQDREKFADFWNELGVIHIIQCRHLFLKSVEEFTRAVELNPNYSDAQRNSELIHNVKKGFLILLRAILK